MIGKSEEFLYFQNKAKHYENLRTIRSPVAQSLRRAVPQTIPHMTPHLITANSRPSLPHSPKLTQLLVLPEQGLQFPNTSPSHGNRHCLPYETIHRRKIENEHLIDRIVHISKSKAQIASQGYSRYFKIDRKFRYSDPHRSLEHQKIENQNEFQRERLRRISPAIGCTSQWDKQYGKTIELKRNMSRFWGTKGKLQLSTDRYVPKALKSFVENAEEGKGKSMNIDWNKLMELPEIHRKEKTFLFQG